MGLLAGAALAPIGGALAQGVKGKPKYGTFGLDLDAMDRTVVPGEDFYRYVNGTWLKTAAAVSSIAVPTIAGG